jgi:FkbM family methyltransferase
MGLRHAAKRAIQSLLGAFGLEVRRRRRPPTPAATRRPDPHATLGAHVAAVLGRERVDCVVDVGAHEGGFGRLLRSNGWTGRIVSFEPVSASFDRLAAATAADALWSVHRVALGRASGRRRINVTEGTVFSSFLEPSAAGSALWPEWTAHASDEEVEIRRLDEVLDDAAGDPSPGRIFLKIDTQGFDLEVFAGATAALDRIVGLQSELSLRPIYEGMPTYLEALQEFGAAGFAITGLYPVTRDPEWRVIEYDAVMIRG